MMQKLEDGNHDHDDEQIHEVDALLVLIDHIVVDEIEEESQDDPEGLDSKIDFGVGVGEVLVGQEDRKHENTLAHPKN